MSHAQMNHETISEKELFEEWMRTEVSFFDELGLQRSTTYGDEVVTNYNNFIMFDYYLDGRDDPADHMRRAEEGLENALDLLKLARKSFDAWRQTRIVMLEEPDEEASKAAFSAWEQAAGEAERNPRYHKVAAPSDEASFLEDGRTPAVLSEPDFVDMTVEDVKSISAV